ncbi:hypothetical protein COT78_00035 [Candidatus Berkelbacteria bacterium CG10_big_fil_rev_8_21_14_0_10_43_13]|uniref:Uncharacterized protein n=1 Tax=Candidatus Berkelbacteria bacterium CG10_big_fil_rev_8_21_14_0_10_43_13 TaxID=1974514 RepID=A0A2H0W9P0_9BACT|nr:MAG: hypothetical protein COT78_00035 [Candidatus Berkelbacteria bacterium CG10_big_fil_rev_8_21_14_0_10_43_13]
MKKIFVLISLALIGLLLTAKHTYAICQVVCPIVVGGTLTLLEKYGVDNTISGLWIGGMLVWASIVTIDWIAKWKRHWLINIAIFVAFYAATIIPLYNKNIIGLSTKMLWGLDKTILGIIIGSIFFYLGDRLYIYIKAKNGGHAWFPFQKALMPIIPLIIWSAIFHFLVK